MWRNQQPQDAEITMSSNDHSEWFVETFSVRRYSIGNFFARKSTNLLLETGLNYYGNIMKTSEG